LNEIFFFFFLQLLPSLFQ